MWQFNSDGTVDANVSIDVCLEDSLTRVDRGCAWDYADLTARIERPIKPSFTPSAMLGCHRERWLKQSVDYAVDPADSHAKVRGTRAHSGLEIDHADVLSEVTVARSIVVDGESALVVTRPDKVYPKTGLIHDDKTRGYIAQKDKEPVPPEISDDYRYQLSVGAWAWEDPAWADASVKEGHGDRNVSPSATSISTGQITFRDQTKQVRVAVPLIPHSELIPWMEIQIRDLRKIYQGGYGLPSHGNNSESGPAYLPPNQQWKCKTCPVRKQCGIQLSPKRLDPSQRSVTQRGSTRPTVAWPSTEPRPRPSRSRKSSKP